MTLKLKEITVTAKAIVNTGDYSNLSSEVTLTAETDGDPADILALQDMAQAALTYQVSAAVENRLIAGMPSLNGKVGNTRRAALESQACTKVLATLNPDLAKEVVDRVLEMSLVPEKVRVDLKD